MLRPLVLRRFLLAAACELLVLSFSPTSFALPGGIASGSCNSCHSGSAEATLSLDFEPAVVQPGELVTLTLHITHSGMQGAGFFIQNLEFPNFSDISGQPTHATGDGVTHTSPLNPSGGEATVQVAWTAPSEPAGTLFNVAVVASNGDRSSRGDATTWSSFGLVWGCDGITLYWDGDNDGYGSEELGTSPGCAARQNWATLKGDCDGGDPAVNPGATEICNEDDDDCDADVDEGTNPRTLYPDADGDGFGKPGAESMSYCGSLEGYADNSEDCNDTSAQIRPGMTETCNTLDDNCDGRADEGACSTATPDTTPVPSSSDAAQPSSSGPTPGPAPAVDEPDADGVPPVNTMPTASAAEPAPARPTMSASMPAAQAPITTQPAGGNIQNVPASPPGEGTALPPADESAPSCALKPVAARPSSALEMTLLLLGLLLRVGRSPSRSPTR